MRMFCIIVMDCSSSQDHYSCPHHHCSTDHCTSDLQRGGAAGKL